jgi:hypothetical protein
MALPETIAEDDDGGGRLARRRVGRNDPAAEQRGDAEMIRIVGVNDEAANVFRKVAVGRGGILVLESDDTLERFKPAHLGNFGTAETHRGIVPFRIAKIDDREAICVAVGVRIDEDGVDDAEDGGGGADAECEGEDGGDGEGGAFAKFAERVAEVGGDVHASLVRCFEWLEVLPG